VIISGKPIQGVIKTYSDQNKISKSEQVKPVSRSMKPDEVILSSHGQEIGHIYQAYKNAPDIRQDKIRDLSERISRGDYNVSAKDVAAKIVE